MKSPASQMTDAFAPAEQARRFRTLRSVVALMLREMSTTYGRSAGGFFWAVAEPVAGIALLSFAFSLAFHAPSLGDSFPVFYASGYLPFMLYFDGSRKIALSIAFSRPLLMYPAVTYIDALFARFAINLLTHVLVFCIVVLGLRYFFEMRGVLDYAAISRSLAMAAGLAFGIGVLNCFLFSMFPVWDRIWGIVNRPMFIISAVVFTPESLPEPFRSWLMINPLVHVVGEMRRGFYPTYGAPYVSYAYVVAWIGITLALGLGLLRLYRGRIMSEM